ARWSARCGPSVSRIERDAASCAADAASFSTAVLLSMRTIMTRPIVLRLAGVTLALGLTAPALADETTTFWSGLYQSIQDAAKTWHQRMGATNQGTPVVRECNPNLWVGRAERCPGEAGYQPPRP